MVKKNVLFIINQLHSGGAEKVVANLAQDLSSFCNVHIVIFNDLDKVGYPIKGNLIKIKLPFSKTANQNAAPARALRLLLLIRHLRKIKKQNKIDVAISFLEASNIVNIISKKQEKVFVSVRSYLTEEISKNSQISIYRPLIKKLYKRADAIIVPSQLQAEDLVLNFGLGKEKIHEIHNYLDIDQINKQKEEVFQHIQFEAIFKSPVLINVGRLHPAKGQLYLLSVLKKVKEVNPAVKLVILGDGILKTSLIQRCNQLALKICAPEQLLALGEEEIVEYDVFLLGMQKNPYQFLNKSCVFLFPSLYEGFPNALLEAMAVGLPVIAADCNAGPREILAPGTDLKYKAINSEATPFGILMPPVNSEVTDESSYSTDYEGTNEWASVVTGLLTDHQKISYYSERSKMRAMDYSKEIIIEKWSYLINK